MEPTASLAVLIYNFSGMPFENQIELAWAASLVLVLLVLALNLIGQILLAAAPIKLGACHHDQHGRPPLERHRPRHGANGRRRSSIASIKSCTTATSRPSATRRSRSSKRHDHGLHRPVGLRQEHGAALPQPHERPGARLPLRGPRPLPRQGHLRPQRRSGGRAPLHRHGLPAAESVRHEHLSATWPSACG